jgi:hypothetical protein
MRQSLLDILASVHSSFKASLVVGPFTLAVAAIGSLVLGVALWDRPNEHTDVYITIGIVIVVLTWVEIALARRFVAHEEVERRDREHLARLLVAESQAHINRAVMVMDGVASRYDGLVRDFRTVAEEVARRGPILARLETSVEHLHGDLSDMKEWRELIMGRRGVPAGISEDEKAAAKKK